MLLLDREGTPLQSLRIDTQARRGPWTSLSEVSPALIEAVLLSEDQRFFEHGGVDWLATARAASAVAGQRLGLSAQTTGGASTISMQVAAMLRADLARPGGGRMLSDKLAQMQAARSLEAAWSKAEILEYYLNRVSFRGELQGIAAASEHLFGKAPHGLDAIESALLAALIRAPQAPRAQVEARACALLKRQDRAPDCAKLAFEIDRWSLHQRGLDRYQQARQLAPHAARHLLTHAPPRPGAAWRSSLYAPLQKAALEAVQRHLQQLANRNAHDAAVVVLDHASGEVLAYVGSSAALSEAQAVDAARAPRQAGSTLKPFIYALALERRLITAASLLDDAPFSVDVGGGAYTPQNYGEDFVGPVSVRTALASSLNIPAIRALHLVGIEPAHRLLRQTGFSSLHADPAHYGYSLALGSADVSLLELTNAYRMLARGGFMSAPRWRADEAPGPERRLLSPATAWLIGDILADRGARYLSFGFDNPLAVNHWAAVKTGTSKDMRDNWAIGWNARVTVGVWVGNAQGRPMHGVSGISGAGPIWAEVIETAAKLLGAGPPSPPPPSLQRRQVAWLSTETEANGTLIDSPLHRLRGTSPKGAGRRVSGGPEQSEGWALAHRGQGEGGGKTSLSSPHPCAVPEDEGAIQRFPCDRTGLEPARREWFLTGTQPSHMPLAARAQASVGARIVSPSDGSIIALDPDIPREHQRLPLVSGEPTTARCWSTETQTLGCAERLLWQPEPGEHQLRLLDHDGRERDRVRILVRGRVK